jgi:hypothetical protein
MASSLASDGFVYPKGLYYQIEISVAPLFPMYSLADQKVLPSSSSTAPTQGFHADQARRQVGQPRLDLAARPLLPQHNRAALIEADNVE